jgi:TolB-like protein/AraC-like DNA-binding protein
MNDYLSSDQQFIGKLTTIVEANLSEKEFDCAELAREAHMSRTAIHRRLRSQGIRNTSKFIREIRLRKAREMLQEGSITSSEVAYRVGFSSPAYFSKCFHEFFGYPPGEVKKRVITGEVASAGTSSKGIDAGGKSTAGILSWRNTFIALALITLIVVVFVILGNKVSLFRSKDLSIVVMPFKNLSDNPENQYLADGITEDILNNLCHISDLRVISRSTSEHFRGTDLTAREIARQIEARNVLEGSVRQDGELVRISIQLIDAQRDQYLWSENFDRKLANLLGIQGEIALRVANKLNAVITESEAKQIRDVLTLNPDAYDFYIRGRFLLHRSINEQRTDIDKEGLTGSIRYFENAVASDPGFVEAYAGLAQAWFDLSAYGWIPLKDGFPKARDYSLKALEIDHDCAEAHTVLGAYHGWGDRNFEEARSELKMALKLKPDYPVANQYYAQVLMIVGPLEETRIFLDRALQLEPHFWILHNLNAYVCYFEGKYTEAIKACKIARDLHEVYPPNDWLFFLNYAKLGEGEKATEALQGIVSKYSDKGTSFDNIIADAYRHSGIDGLFTWVIETNINSPMPVFGLNGFPYNISWWYAILGDKEKSIYWLEKNMERKLKGHFYLDLIVSNPDFDILRDDVRFKAIVEELGLTPYNNRPPALTQSR